MHPLDVLRYHVTGAIARGTAQAITEKRYPDVTITAGEAKALHLESEAYEAYIDAHCRDKRTGWASYKPEDHPNIPPFDNEKAGKLEAWEFSQGIMGHHIFAYLSSDGTAVTTFNGVVLLKVTYEHEYRSIGFGGRHKMVSVRAETSDGIKWYGRGLGRGMYVRLHRCKRQ